jgi:alpha-glucosidase
LRTPEAQEAFFQKLQDFGVAGAKIDFFDHEHRDVIDLYQTLLRKGAEHKVLVNFHGANKPTGESRTWPNELIREGVRGMEASRLKERARHDATLPFTRYLAGPADYTPVLFGARRGDTTWAHQIATAVVFTEPLLTYGANPTNLLSNPALPLIKSIPSVWDETLVLKPSEIGQLALMARRTGRTWFVGAVNGPAARKIHMPLGFMSGRRNALLVSDDPANPASVKVEERAFEAEATLEMDLSSGGGFAARFTE